MRDVALIMQDSGQHREAENVYQDIGEPRLFEFYNHVMEDIEIRQIPSPTHCKKVLLAVCLAYRPLSLPELAAVTGLKSKFSHTTIEEYSFLLVVRDGTVHLAHPSVKSYLKERFHPIEIEQAHVAIVGHSIDEISRLKQNIHNQKDNLGQSDIATPDPDPDPLVPIRYSCIHWPDHLLGHFNYDTAWLSVYPCLENLLPVSDQSETSVALHRYVESICLVPISSLIKYYQIQRGANSQLSELLEDAELFILRHQPVLQHAPLQIYRSALTFSPMTSEIRKHP
jgi:hypothetical protein